MVIARQALKAGFLGKCGGPTAEGGQTPSLAQLFLQVCRRWAYSGRLMQGCVPEPPGWPRTRRRQSRRRRGRGFSRRRAG